MIRSYDKRPPLLQRISFFSYHLLLLSGRRIWADGNKDKDRDQTGR
jgi:hypothetical protein